MSFFQKPVAAEVSPRHLQEFAPTHVGDYEVVNEPPADLPSVSRIARPAGSRRRRHPQSGIALIITLILLAVIAVVVMAFLALSSRERSSVTDAGSQKDAELMAQTALERAKAVILLGMRTNMLGPDLAVSRSFPETNVWTPDIITNLGGVSPVGDFRDPRVPVFVNTNRGAVRDPLDSRHYLDLNRNAMHEQNGFLWVDVLGNITTDPSRAVTTNWFVGDPEWIGLQRNPNLPHSGRNLFLGRFAYLIQPVGRALDANFIHNQAKTWLNLNDPVGSLRRNGFLRNEGFGSWELNFAGFLADLNTNEWTLLPRANLPWTPSGFLPDFAPNSGGNLGYAYDDATDFLRYRYGGSVNNLKPFGELFGYLYGVRETEFDRDTIDGYADGPLQLDTVPLPDNDLTNRPWCGAENVNRIFSVQDFYNSGKVGQYLPSRLASAGASPDTYDRYTYYRLLAQMATDSVPPKHRMHINYADLGTNTGGLFLSATNFFPWKSDDPTMPDLSVMFLTNVACAMFQKQFQQFPFFTNAYVRSRVPNSAIVIPIAPTNEYGPAVHRIFQVAANILDATRTNRFPSVFRPLFTPVGTDELYLTGFTNDNRRSTLDAYLSSQNSDGIPLVIGAKKGYPNFNEYTLRTDVQVTRKLELVRRDTNSAPHQTNQMFVLGISNLFALEAWNSYLTPYSNQLSIEARNLTHVSITNRAGLQYVPTIAVMTNGTTLPANFWEGNEFLLPLNTNVVLLANSVYRLGTKAFDPININNYERGSGFPQPEWFLTISNRVWFILNEGDNIVDFFVNHSLSATMDVDAEMFAATQLVGVNGAVEDDVVSGLWDTNRLYGSSDEMSPTRGVLRQVNVALGNEPVPDTVWKSFNGAGTSEDKQYGIDKFRNFCGLTPLGTYTGRQSPPTTDRLFMQTPFCPSRKLVKTTTWQVNDPLVHYHVGDMLLFPTNAITDAIVPPLSPIPTNITLATVGQVNRRYSPWGGNPGLSDFNNPAASDFDLAIKDAGVLRSDDWEFPNGKFPSVGWLGRVHRGSPWQTIYLKHVEPEATEEEWREQSADYLWYPTNMPQQFRFVRAHPTNDWLLADLFTVGIGPNATRGLLSVNQTNLAAWSAVFSGISVLTNAVDDQTLAEAFQRNPSNSPTAFLKPIFIEPAGPFVPNNPPPLAQIVEAINRYRAAQPGGVFSNLAQFVQVPELTVRSPWLNTASDMQRRRALNDTAYERIPQQILSLVQVGEPRFVIYAFGQSLRPAPRSVLFDTGYQQLCTNYQVMGEVYTRAVARVEGSPPRLIIESYNLMPTD